MSFDKEWFDSLSDLEENVVDQIIPSSPRRAPRVEEAIEQLSGPPDQEFLAPLVSLVEKLQDRGHIFGSQFRLEGQHVYTYSRGRAYKCQNNIGFWARNSRKMRIGRGLRVGGPSDLDSDSPRDFVGPIYENSKTFDTLYERLGGYHEPDHLSENSRVDAGKPSDYFTEQSPMNSGWMFFGACLNREDPAHRWLFQKVDRVADFAADVLDLIEESPFGGN